MLAPSQVRHSLHITAVTSGELSRNAIRVGGCLTSSHPTAGRPANNTLQLRYPDKTMDCNRDTFLRVETKNTSGNSITTELNTRMELCDNNTMLETRNNLQILELSISSHEPVEGPYSTSKLCAATNRSYIRQKPGANNILP